MKELKLTKGKISLLDDEDYVKALEAGKWCVSGGYAYNRRHGLLHRFLLGFPKGTQGVKGRSSVQVDHINHDKLDNRRDNLRVASITENARNKSVTTNSYTRLKGAHFDSYNQHWMARIRVDGRLVYLGVFETDVDAAAAYNKAATYYFGEYAKLNDLRNVAPSDLRSRPKDLGKAHKPRKNPLPFTL